MKVGNWKKAPGKIILPGEPESSVRSRLQRSRRVVENVERTSGNLLIGSLTEAPNLDFFGDRVHAFDPADCTLGCHLLGVMGYVTC